MVSLSFREYALFAISLLAAVWFFVGYPSQDPRAVIDNMQLDHTTAEEKAHQIFDNWGYPLPRYIGVTSFSAHPALMDTLQKKLGRRNMIQTLKISEYANVKPFYWETVFRLNERKGAEITVGGDDGRQDVENNALIIRLDDSGKLIEFLNRSNIEPSESVNRNALATIFDISQDSAMALLSAYDDKTLSSRFNIVLQSNRSQDGITSLNRPKNVSKILKRGGQVQLLDKDFYKIAAFYLEQSGWDITDLKPDTVQISRDDNHNIATVMYESSNSSLDIGMSLKVGLTATGGLLSMRSDYDMSTSSNSSDELWSIIRTAFILLFGLWAVIIFFYRIRDRAIDTKPALVVAILCGLAVSVVVLLLIFSVDSFFIGVGKWTQTAMAFVGAGLSGAATSLAFFVLFSVGDSLTRQHWSHKLNVYDYVRQGMIFNKPVGLMLVRSVMLAFILAGVWTVLLQIFPNIWMSIEDVFITERALWPPIYLTFSDGVYSLGLILSIFVVLGGQIFGQTKSKVLSGLLIIIACGIVVPVSGNYSPGGFEFLLGALLGLIMVFIYLQWDFLTLLLSHFLFLGLVDTAQGWYIAGSPDAYIFLLLIGLITGLFGVGIAAIAKGKRENLLTRYVPQYVEELAQEERIKQELQIAREVQQSFLPLETPEFDELDLAAICKPAYETGGDYYDFVRLDDHRLAVTIGDVSGKGIQAAFYMTFIKGILHSLCHEIDSPAEILKRVNRLFYDNARRGTFISLIYGIIDLKKQTFTFVRAGHNPVLKISGDSGTLEELQPQGIGVGLSKENFAEQLEEVELSLNKGDMIMLYTDGIVEALSEFSTFYGSKRLNRMVKNNAQKSAQRILELLSEDIRSFIGKAKQHDDMTIMIMKVI